MPDHKTIKCDATFAPMNGETVSPCHKPAGHEGDHEGYCLGSIAIWSSPEKHTDEEEEARKRYEEDDLARAAIAAMGEGKKWGVLRVKRKVWIGCAPINNNDFVTTDHMAALLMCDLMSKRYPNERYEVREYVEQEKAKTAEEIADECLAPIDIKEKHRRVTVAIENARKQNPS
jgi:hypothetical protein